MLKYVIIANVKRVILGKEQSLFKVTSKFMDQMNNGISGPFRVTIRNKKYILVIKDRLTKFVYTFCLQDKSQEEVVRALMKLVRRVGAPKVLISDNGREFNNKLMITICKELGTHKIFTTPVNPRSDGLVENQMRSLKDSLVAYMKEDQTDWDEYVDTVTWYYNTTVNDAINRYTPFYLMFGRESYDYISSRPLQTEQTPIYDYIEGLHHALKVAWYEASKHVLKNSENFNKQHIPREFKPFEKGDWFFHSVMARNFYQESVKSKKKKVLSHKLQYRYSGPFLVVEVISPVLYTALIHGNLERVHAINMKHA